MVARATGVFGVVGPWVYGVTGVVGQPSDTSAWFPGCRLVYVDRTDSDDRESGCSEFLGCASLGVAHGGRGTIRTVTASYRTAGPSYSAPTHRSLRRSPCMMPHCPQPRPEMMLGQRGHENIAASRSQ
jgi:hypothetical protein